MHETYTLRQGPQWNLQAMGCQDRKCFLDIFHGLARQYGSSAVWQADLGSIYTTDRLEQARNLPYEGWAVEAFQAILNDWWLNISRKISVLDRTGLCTFTEAQLCTARESQSIL